MNNSKYPAKAKIVVEIPDVLDPAEVDRKYIDSLRQLLHHERVGDIVGVEQGEPNTSAEFSRFITVEAIDYDGVMNVLQKFLVESDAPAGTMIISYHSDGEIRDIVMLAPSDGGA